MAAQKVRVRKPRKLETRPRKPGGGLKPKPATVLRRQIVENKVAEAEASFAFLVEVRDAEDWPKPLRLDAAKEILNRVLGKPSEPQNHSGEIVLRVIRDASPRTDNPPNPAAPATAAHQEPSGQAQAHSGGTA